MSRTWPQFLMRQQSQIMYLAEGWEANQGFYGFRLKKHFSDECGIPLHYVKIEFLEYLTISGDTWYPNGPIGYRNLKKLTIQKEACIAQVGRVIHGYQGEGAIWSRNCQWWNDGPGWWAHQMSIDNVNFGTLRHKGRNCSTHKKSSQHQLKRRKHANTLFLHSRTVHQF